jgi:hypothetical protein
VRLLRRDVDHVRPADDSNAAGLGGLQRVARALADHAPLLLRHGGVDVQHERVGIDTDSATMNGTLCFISPLM